jgi:hypothetical protein
MIVVVEGPTAAGKTTWVRKHHADSAVWEYTPDGREPGGDADANVVGAYWAEANARRWQQAIEIETTGGLAVCDSDPCKLYYTWTLWRIGAVDRARWTTDAKHARGQFERHRLGLADLVLVELPSMATLRRRREGDTSRRRRNFDLHVQLAGPLREWYAALDQLEPGHVAWELPDNGLDPNNVPRRTQRTGGELLDALIELLPLRSTTPWQPLDRYGRRRETALAPVVTVPGATRGRTC